MGKKNKNVSQFTLLLNSMKRRSLTVKLCAATMILVSSFAGLTFFVKDQNHFFVASESIHALGILVLIYKLASERSCSGLSLKSQEITAMFLVVRLGCSVMLEGDVHTFLDFATLVLTVWVIYMIRFKLKSSYIKELDNLPLYYMVVPSAVLALLIHPYHTPSMMGQIMWAFCVYLESVSVMPQLRMMQKAKMIEPFTGHYVFALGIARFLSCAHWLIKVYESGGAYFYMVGAGYFWSPVAVLAEIVQTFVLADFCYYYIKSFMEGQLLMKMPV